MDNNHQRNSIDSIYNHSDFQHIVRKKNRFLFIMSSCFLTFYLVLPLLFFTIQTKFSGMFAWFYVFSLFLLTWLIGWIHWKRMKDIEQQVNKLAESKTR
ncbi:DUF485 domain-containing protein [Ornithinibacillus caprae]|nr:DUF485 domain-containing protein [Ornithinibacillus caprae]